MSAYHDARMLVPAAKVRLLSLLEHGPATFGALVTGSGLRSGTVAITLTRMESRGIVVRGAGLWRVTP